MSFGGREEGRGRRLIIHSIVMENFKSYAGRVEVGPFHNQFSSVVGPNGSGKSNLIECLLFIFGFSASWMRLSRLSQLIHNSFKCGEVQRAGVEVQFAHLLDSGERTPAFTVKRTVNQASVSKYFLDGAESTQAEVKEALMREGIDLTNNRFLILQGQVELISQMKPKSGDPDNPGLLQYLETIIGSIEFKRRIEDLAERLLTVEEQRHEKGERMKLVEGEARGMEEAKNRAVKVVKKERALCQIRSVLAQLAMHVAKKELEEQARRRAAVQKQREEVRATQRVNIMKHNKVTEEVKHIQLQVKAINAQLANCKEQVSRNSVRDKELQSNLEYAQKDLSQAEEKSEEVAKEMLQLQKLVESIREKHPPIEREVKESKAIISKSEAELKALGYSGEEGRLSELRARLADGESSLLALKQKADLVSSHPLMRPREQPREQAELQQTLKKESEKLERVEAGLAKFKETSRRIKVEQERLRQQLEGLRSEEAKYTEEIEKKSAIVNSKDEVGGGVLGALLRAQKEGRLTGIIGRLGDLGRIPDAYDVAISNSTPALDNILVDSQEEAGRILRFLKENKVGVATLICLSEIRGQTEQRIKAPFRTPSQSQRLFDLVECDSHEARLGFYFALKDTLVVKDMATANRIAYGHQNGTRYRVVTLAGNVINLDGSQFGGGNPRRGLLGKGRKAISKDEVAKAENEMRQAIRDLGSTKQNIRELEEKERETATDFDDCRQELEQREMGRKMQQEVVDEVRLKFQRMAGAKALTKRDEAELKRLREELEKLNGQTQAAAEQNRRLASTIAQEEESHRKRMTPEVRRLLLTLQNYRLVYKRAEGELINIKTSVESIVPRNAKALREKEQYRGKEEELRRRIEEIKRERLNLEESTLKFLLGNKELGEKKQKLEQEERRIRLDDEQFCKFLEEIKRRLDKFKEEAELIAKDSARSSENAARAKDKLAEVRRAHADTLQHYPFLEQLAEIEEMGFGGSAAREQWEDISFISTNLEEKSSRRRSNIGIQDVADLFEGNPLEDLLPEQLEKADSHAKAIEICEPVEAEKLKKLYEGEGLNLNVLVEFRRKFEEFKAREGEYNELKAEHERAKEELARLKEQRLRTFLGGFTHISGRVKEVYQFLTRGGDAELELVDSLDPFSNGISFSVRPPKKSWKEIGKLSGGEKTLSSLSLVFALHSYRPTPIYFMDEIDAALDFRNVAVVGNFVKQKTRNAQFIIISLRSNMFELADKLVGVYKVEDRTRVVCLIPQLMAGEENKDPNEADSQ